MLQYSGPGDSAKDVWVEGLILTKECERETDVSVGI